VVDEVVDEVGKEVGRVEVGGVADGEVVVDEVVDEVGKRLAEHCVGVADRHQQMEGVEEGRHHQMEGVGERRHWAVNDVVGRRQVVAVGVGRRFRMSVGGLTVDCHSETA
jgi:hypothetical protein